MIYKTLNLSLDLRVVFATSPEYIATVFCGDFNLLSISFSHYEEIPHPLNLLSCFIGGSGRSARRSPQASPVSENVVRRRSSHDDTAPSPRHSRTKRASANTSSLTVSNIRRALWISFEIGKQLS